MDIILTVSVNVEPVWWSLSEMKYVRRLNSLVQIMLLRKNGPQWINAKWAADEILVVALKCLFTPKVLERSSPFSQIKYRWSAKLVLNSEMWKSKISRNLGSFANGYEISVIVFEFRQHHTWWKFFGTIQIF